MTDSTRGQILLEAGKIINGERQNMYGSPEDNFEVIANMWTEYLNGRNVIRALDVAMMMALLKIARISSGCATHDSFVDACGYIALGSDISETMARLEDDDD